ncbi:MAG: lysine--tRNA ligase [Patescibacteria group bacterium]
MIWVDREVKEIKKRNKKLELVDDMKTPSGRVHIGSLRGVVVHDMVYKVLKENNINAKYTYVFDDHDPMDGIPAYLEYKKWEKYAGMQLYKIPSPEKGHKNFAQCYANEFIKVFNSINSYPEIIWASELYNSGKMNDVIKEVLDNASKIRDIYNKAFDRKKPNDWHPFNVVCENCQKIGTTYVYKWDGEQVHYRCEEKMVAWAVGCGNEGAASPYDGNGKLVWRVDWPAKWKVIGVTVEGAGKDHMSSGGSYDIAKIICDKVLDYPAPYPVAYEFFNVKGKKMSSSKGLGVSAKEIAKLVPPEILRFIIVRTPIHKAIDFDTDLSTLNKLFDDYDTCLNAYFDKIEDNIPEGKSGEVLLDFARIAELSQVNDLPKNRVYLPRFRSIVNILSNNTDPLIYFEKHKNSKLTKEEKDILNERIKYAKIYANTNDRSTGEELILTSKEKSFLIELAANLKGLKSNSNEDVQEIIFSTLKKNGSKPKDVFPGIYKVLINKKYGPKAADIILSMGVDNVVKKFTESK